MINEKYWAQRKLGEDIYYDITPKTKEFHFYHHCWMSGRLDTIKYNPCPKCGQKFPSKKHLRLAAKMKEFKNPLIREHVWI